MQASHLRRMVRDSSDELLETLKYQIISNRAENEDVILQAPSK